MVGVNGKCQINFKINNQTVLSDISCYHFLCSR